MMTRLLLNYTDAMILIVIKTFFSDVCCQFDALEHAEQVKVLISTLECETVSIQITEVFK